MASVGISVLIASVSDEIDIFLSTRHIWSKNLPVIAAIFEPDLAFEGLAELLSDS